VVRHLTERDRVLLRLLARYKVFTSFQVTDLLFNSETRARSRLVELHRLRLIDRFEPHDPRCRNPPYHYVLGRLGTAVIAAERGDDPAAAVKAYKPAVALGLGRSQRLRHRVGTNGFFVALAAYARHHPEANLAAWWSEEDCADWCGEYVRPDGLGDWEEHGVSVEFLLEYDLGTEPLGRLTDKLAGYEKLEHEGGASTWLVFAFQSHRRETSARAALMSASVPIATAALSQEPRPYGAVWQPLYDENAARVRLSELARLAKPRAALDRAASGGTRAWRFERKTPADG
jgi:hypothetical protein